MRIAIATEVHAPKIDGISNRLTHTIRELIALGHDVLTITPAPAEPVCDGERLLQVPGARFPLYPDVVVGAPDPRIVLELVRFRPHVLHAVGPVAVGTFGLLAARALAIPTVASYHTDLPGYAQRYGYPELEAPAWKLLRRAHALAELNLCPSRATRDALVARGFEITGLWRGGVDPELFHPRKRSLVMRERLAGGRVDRPLLLYVGRLAAEKNLHSLAPVLAELPGVRLAFVGDGPERARLERTYRKLPVTFAGFLSGEDLAAAYASADVFVMPSATETLGFVALEAMASGLPVVAADAGGLREVVEHEETGFLYDPAESKGALEPVRRILGSRTLAADLARSGRAAAERCSWRSETRALVASYEFAIERAEARSLRVKLRSFFAA
ncbi:MAG TPA: glycosyltransferase [Myxococcota bacterium]|nr:glycosyltransferase [Myxococcota bacterium]